MRIKARRLPAMKYELNPNGTIAWIIIFDLKKKPPDFVFDCLRCKNSSHLPEGNFPTFADCEVIEHCVQAFNAFEEDKT